MRVYQEFAGIKFREEYPGGYYIHNFNGYNIRMHRFVWEYYNGPIPDGYEVHHINGDKSKNDISNLQLMCCSEHKKLHAETLSEEERERRRVNLRTNAIPKAIEWHKSDVGSAWHTQNIKQQWETGAFLGTRICSNCGKEYTGYSKGGNTFCSNACKSAYRRKSGIDDIEKICPVCSEVFKTNKHRQTECCSKHCSMILRHRREKES